MEVTSEHRVSTSQAMALSNAIFMAYLIALFQR